jgi:hypothetical protein
MVLRLNLLPACVAGRPTDDAATVVVWRRSVEHGGQGALAPASDKDGAQDDRRILHQHDLRKLRAVMHPRERQDQATTARCLANVIRHLGE